MKNSRGHRNFVGQSTKTIFYTVFFLVFCCSGALTMLGVLPYRMAVASLFVIPLIAIHGLRIDRILIAYLLLAAEVVISAIYNESTIGDLGLFLRILIFSYLIYYLVEQYVTSATIVRIIKLCINIGIVQLPIVLFQQQTYDLLPTRLTSDLIPIDYGFGTFNYKGDYAMGFYLIALIIFLLFDHKRNHIVKHKTLIVLWFSATVFIANSEMNKLALALILSLYLVTQMHQRNSLILMSFLVLLVGLSSVTGITDDIREKLEFTFQTTQRQLSGINSSDIDAFLRGSYSRGAAVHYYLNQPILWVGDGPSRYSNALTRELLRGNTGHIFTFYSEIGLLGWLTSIVIFYGIAFRHYRWRAQPFLIPGLLLFAIQMLSFTSQVMNDISIVLIYCLIVKTYLIPVYPEVPAQWSIKLTNSLQYNQKLSRNV